MSKDDLPGTSHIMQPSAQRQVNTNPLQRPGRDRLLREGYEPPEATGKDIRMMLDRKTLATLLEVAGSSVTGRVMLPYCRLKWQEWQEPNGHVYITWTMVSGEPKPEPVPFTLGGLGG